MGSFGVPNDSGQIITTDQPAGKVTPNGGGEK